MRVPMTLSRCHKVAERLRAKVAEAAEAVTTGLGIVRIDGLAGESQLAALSASRDKADVALKAHHESNQALQAVRAAIGRANVVAGVSDLLAEQEAIGRRIKLLRGVLATHTTTAIQPDELSEYRPLNQVKEVFSRGDAGVQVTLLTAAYRAQLEAEIAALQKQLYRVSDAVADANATRVTLDLPDNLVEELGF